MYALGAVLYSLTTGRPPFQSASGIETLRQVVEREPVSPRQLNQAIPRDLETIILKCLEKSLPRRYATANLLGDELQRFIDGRPINARPVGRITKLWRWSRRQPMVASLLAAVFLSLTVGIAATSYFAIGETIAREDETKQRVEAQRQTGVARRQSKLAQQQTEIAEQQAEIAKKQTEIAEEARLAEARQTQRAIEKSRDLRRSRYVSDMKQLPTLKTEGKIPRMRELLLRQIPKNANEEDLRSFDWHYWDRQVRPPIALYDLKKPIEVMAASSDERFVAIGCTGGQAYLLDLEEGKLLDEVYPIGEMHWSSMALARSSIEWISVTPFGEATRTIQEEGI